MLLVQIADLVTFQVSSNAGTSLASGNGNHGKTPMITAILGNAFSRNQASSPDVSMWMVLLDRKDHIATRHAVFYLHSCDVLY